MKRHLPFLSLVLLLVAGAAARADDRRSVKPAVPSRVPGGVRLVLPWELQLRSVLVEQKRESHGDRPYFVTIAFQSRVYQRGSTRVEVIEREPHDWVAKAEYRGRASGPAGDHLGTRASIPIPPWMGTVQWPAMEVVDAAEAVRARPHIFGAIIIAFDNNNTPPHAVRGVVEQLGSWLKTFLQREVEPGTILSAVDLRTGAVSEDVLKERFELFGRDILQQLDAGKVVETLFQTTFGSTFNPDKLVGVHALLFPTVRGLPVTRRSETFSAPIVGEQVRWHLLVASPAAMGEDLVFEGSGGKYVVPMRLRNAILPADARRLELSVATGSDDLRRGSRARGYVTLRDGRRGPEVELNRGAEWSRFSENRASLPLPEGARLGDVESVTITFESGSTAITDTTDNWDVEAVTMTAGGEEAVKIARGRPLVRFTGETRTFSIPLR